MVAAGNLVFEAMNCQSKQSYAEATHHSMQTLYACNLVRSNRVAGQAGINQLYQCLADGEIPSQ